MTVGGLQQARDAETVAQRLLQAMARPFELGDQSLSVRCSIGVCTSAPGAASLEEILRNADAAMYHAKNAGKGTYVVFSGQLRQPVVA